MGCVWNILSPAESKVSDCPSQPRKQVEPLLWCLSAGYRGSGRTTNRTPFWHLPRWSCAWGVFGTFCHQPSPKVSDSPSQPSKQVEPLLWCLSAGYRGSGRTTNRTPFWHLPRWSCAWGVFATLSHQPTPKVSDSPSQPSKQVEPLLWCLSAGYRGSVRTTNRTPFWHLPRWSCAWGVFGTLCHQPTPKVSDSPSQPRKQVEPLLWCLSAGYRGSVRTTNRTPFWHLPRWSCAWGVFGTFCHQPSPKVSDSPSQPSKQVEPLLWCLSAGYRGSVRTSNRTPFWHLPRWSCAWGVFGTFCHQPTPKVSDCPSQPRKQVEPLLWCLSAGYRGSVRTTNRTPFWHLPRWSCAWGVFGTISHQPTPKVSDSPSQPSKQVEPLLWCLSAGYRGSGRTTNRTPFWHLPRWSCAWGVFGTFCHQPTPKVSDSPSQPSKQVEPLLWCLSAGYRGSVRTSNRTPFWHLPRGVVHGVCLEHFVTSRVQIQRFPISAQQAGRTTFVVSFSWLPGQCKNYQQNSFLAPSPVELCMGVFGTFCHQPTPKVSDSPSQPRKQVEPLLWCLSAGYRGSEELPTELLSGTFPGGVVHGVCLEHFVTSRVQKSAIAHLSPASR